MEDNWQETGSTHRPFIPYLMTVWHNGKRVGHDQPGTRTRAATRWATHTTNFLPRRITIMARTGRKIEQTSSDEGLW